MAQQPQVDDRVAAYVRAIVGVAKAEGELATVEEELFRFARTFESNDELRMALTDARVPVEQRQGLVEDLVGGRACPLTTAVISFVVGAGRSRDLPEIVDRFVETAAHERQEAVAEVRSAIPLDDAQRERLAGALSKATGKRVAVKVIVDPSVLGGIVAQIGDRVIDGSIRHRLEQLRESL